MSSNRRDAAMKAKNSTQAAPAHEIPIVTAEVYPVGDNENVGSDEAFHQEHANQVEQARATEAQTSLNRNGSNKDDDAENCWNARNKTTRYFIRGGTFLAIVLVIIIVALAIPLIKNGKGGDDGQAELSNGNATNFPAPTIAPDGDALSNAPTPAPTPSPILPTTPVPTDVLAVPVPDMMSLDQWGIFVVQWGYHTVNCEQNQAPFAIDLACGALDPRTGFASTSAAGSPLFYTYILDNPATNDVQCQRVTETQINCQMMDSVVNTDKTAQARLMVVCGRNAPSFFDPSNWFNDGSLPMLQTHVTPLTSIMCQPNPPSAISTSVSVTHFCFEQERPFFSDLFEKDDENLDVKLDDMSFDCLEGGRYIFVSNNLPACSDLAGCSQAVTGATCPATTKAILAEDELSFRDCYLSTSQLSSNGPGEDFASDIDELREMIDSAYVPYYSIAAHEERAFGN